MTFSDYFLHICLIFSIMAASVLLFWHWEAMLISYLAIRKIILPFNNVEELFTTSDFKITLMKGTSAEQKFKYSNNPIWQIGKSNFSFKFHNHHCVSHLLAGEDISLYRCVQPKPLLTRGTLSQD